MDLRKLLGFMCSNVADYLLKIINPTINYSNGVISKLPIRLDIRDEIIDIVDKCIKIARDDWNEYETSWDFKIHPLCQINEFILAEEACVNWIRKRFNF